MSRLYFNQKGSVLVLMAFTIPFLIAISAIAADVGYLYVQRSHMQNIADAAALAGAARLGSGNPAAQELAELYIAKNSNASDVNNIETIRFSEEGSSKTIRVDITRKSPLLFLEYLQKYFAFPPVDLAVYAVASHSGSANSIFDYSIISGAQEGETIDTSKIRPDQDNPDPRVLNLGPGGGSVFNGRIHSNYKLSQGGGSSTVNGEISTAMSYSDPWVKKAQNSFTFDESNLTQGVGVIDISVGNSGLSNRIDAIKNNNTYQGDFTGGLNAAAFGDGVYVTGDFRPGYVDWGGSLDTTTMIIAEGDILFPGNNGKTISENNYIILCSLNGNIDFTFNGPFYGILYAPNGNIWLNNGGSAFYGSLIGKTIQSSSGRTNINYKKFSEGSSGGSSAKIRLIE